LRYPAGLGRVMAPRRRCRSLLILLLAWLCVAGGAGAWAAEGEAPEGLQELLGYRVGVGERLHILVVGEDELTVSLPIGEYGSIFFPLLGELKVSGLTVGDIGDLITNKLKGDYLVDPQVRVKVEEYRKIYLNGYVNKTGAYNYFPGMTVRKAISLAGGFSERASKDKIFVTRGMKDPDDPDVKPALPIGIDDPLQPGDIITVERSFF
jgi:polysaccharide biosynthesis/export protein VpsN